MQVPSIHAPPRESDTSSRLLHDEGHLAAAPEHCGDHPGEAHRLGVVLRVHEHLERGAGHPSQCRSTWRRSRARRPAASACKPPPQVRGGGPWAGPRARVRRQKQRHNWEERRQGQGRAGDARSFHRVQRGIRVVSTGSFVRAGWGAVDHPAQPNQPVARKGLEVGQDVVQYHESGCEMLVRRRSPGLVGPITFAAKCSRSFAMAGRPPSSMSCRGDTPPREGQEPRR